MNWLEELIAQHTDENGVVDKEALMSSIKAESPKHQVPKSVYNDKVAELKTVNDTLSSLKANTQDGDIKAELESARSELASLKTEKREQSVKQALLDAGVENEESTLDYIRFKLGDLELDEDDNIKHLDNKIRSLKEEAPKFFEVSKDKDESTQQAKGFKVQDNKLNDGGNQTPMTKSEIMQIKDPVKRVSAIQENPELFEK